MDMNELKECIKIERNLWIKYNYPNGNIPKLVCCKKEL